MYKNCTKRSVEAVSLVCIFPIDFSRRSTCVWNSCHTTECEGVTSLNKRYLATPCPSIIPNKKREPFLSLHVASHMSLLPHIFKICDGF
jgi:hypothetical protein